MGHKIRYFAGGLEMHICRINMMTHWKLKVHIFNKDNVICVKDSIYFNQHYLVSYTRTIVTDISYHQSHSLNRSNRSEKYHSSMQHVHTFFEINLLHLLSGQSISFPPFVQCMVTFNSFCKYITREHTHCGVNTERGQKIKRKEILPSMTRIKYAAALQLVPTSFVQRVLH